MDDAIIIGCGPAGLSAAIQLKRYGCSFKVFEKNQIGGLARNANLIENYPGFPQGIKGSELTGLFAEQCRLNGIEPVYEEVRNLDYIDGLFYIKTKNSYFRSRYAVVASGTEPKALALANSEKFNGKNIFYDIYELMGVRDKKIAIIGSGDAAFDYAVGFSARNSVTIFNRSSRVKCIPLLWERAKNSQNIVYLSKTSITNILETQSDMVKLEYYSNDDKAIKEGFFDIIVPAIGRKPADSFVSERIYKNQNSLFKAHRLFFIGDFANDICRQVAISAGDGIRAAMRIKCSMDRGVTDF